jgi:5-methylcytosine-specific restriction protein A
MRTVKEWRGKTDNHMPSASVRQRILERENGVCHICKGKIDRPGWHADHVPPLKDGGENRESKIKPAHDRCHRKLTAQQAIERAPIERKKQKHTGAIRPKQTIKSAGFPKAPKPQKIDFTSRRPLFWPASTREDAHDTSD